VAFKALPLLLVLPESGSRWPDAFPAGRRAGLQPWLQPADPALAQALALDHRTPYVLTAEFIPLLLRLDAPLRQALPDRDPERQPLYAFGRPAGQACQRQLRQAYLSFHERVTKILGQSKVRAALVCRVRTTLPPLDLLLSVGNHGDLTGAASPDAGDLTCPAGLARDLRDVLAARFSDLPGKTGLNRSGRDSALGRQYRRFRTPWLTLDVAPQLLSGRDGEISRQRVRQLQERLEAGLVFWCKLEGWLGDGAA
jgi:hypothetical protein